MIEENLIFMNFALCVVSTLVVPLVVNTVHEDISKMDEHSGEHAKGKYLSKLDTWCRHVQVIETLSKLSYFFKIHISSSNIKIELYQIRG